MDVIYAIIAGLQSLIGKTPGQRRRNCRVALLGVSGERCDCVFQS